MAGMSPAAVCVCMGVVDRFINQFRQLGGSITGIAIGSDMITPQGIDADKNNLFFLDRFYSTTVNKQKKK